MLARSPEDPITTDYDALLAYLLHRGLVESARIIESDLSFFDESRRNCNIKVVSKSGRSYFLKRSASKTPRTERSYAGRSYGSIEYEAAVYALLSTHSRPDGFKRYLPHCYGFDGDCGLLILEALAGDSIGASHHQTGQVPLDLASELGRAVATLHNDYRHDLTPWEALRDSPAPPWSTVFPEPTEIAFRNVSGAVLSFLSVLLESSSLCEQLLDLKASWLAHPAVIHGDLRWSNCLSLPGSGAQTSIAPELRIVDWELATVGDPAWDLGAVFCEYLNSWVSSVPIRSAMEPDQFLSLATAPLQKMHESISSFWLGYRTTRGATPGDSSAMLLRACRNTGARLIQVACEELHDESQVTAKSLSMLQLADNIIARPIEAAVRLFGIPLAQATGAHGNASD